MMKRLLCMVVTLLTVLNCSAFSSKQVSVVNTKQGETGRVIVVDMLVLEQTIMNNRLGANIPNGQVYALERDVVPMNHPTTKQGVDKNEPVNPKNFVPGKVRLASFKRPRPMVIRANVGDTLEIHFRNLLPCSEKPQIKAGDICPTIAANQPSEEAGVQVMGLDWGDDKSKQKNATRIKPGETFTYKYVARGEGVFMMYSPNGKSIPSSQLDYGLFGAVNVQPQEAEWYRSQVTRDDIALATYRVSDMFMNTYWVENNTEICQNYLGSKETGLPEGVSLRRLSQPDNQGLVCPPGGEDTLWEMLVPTLRHGEPEKVSEVLIRNDGFLNTKTHQPVMNYKAVYPADHFRAGSPVLGMLAYNKKTKQLELAHSDLTAIITGPNAGRFPYYLDSPSFRENPATPDRRQPYREFTIAYHISPNTKQAFPAFDNGPLSSMLAAGGDHFAVNYGVAGIAPEIYANRIDVGPMGINEDGVDLLFEEFFLSAWAVGDPAVLVDTPANTGGRATKAFYPDDPSNVYHSYMRDHVKFRVLNAGSVAPHVHHQHAHQWLHTPNSDDGHYLDSQMIIPGSTYTLEMTYNGSGNRNQTVGDSIFHCHIYPHFAQGMWSMWRVHDVFEEGTELDSNGIPVEGARALPDGEIVMGTPIPGLVPLPSLGMAPMPAEVHLVENGRKVEVTPSGTDTEGNPTYENPGFPFFVPGLAGHRAPHPPLDFAWKEDKDKKQKIYSEKEADAKPFRDAGEAKYLDGGLPRHLIFGGTDKSEFHSRWDFSKEAETMNAVELPEAGTAVERAAMAAHATRTHATHLPDGLPGNFILNGLPPAPGAPFAAPEVDDDGNSTFNERRYKAAVIQTDVVFNKEGWHYPQQRFITLLDDVKDTIGGEKPPEPFFFRANTGETIEFWHTNLVPNYYQLDDFQVRTPTDILGQHIHLVKFDVTSSDGAANGFNYEDGTFSPDEVRSRITAMNKAGGMHHYDPVTQSASSKQSMLTPSSYVDDYGNSLGKPPANQDWNGAQTTIQRFDTDPLLNHEGEDRTLRTVFTHDHFGPSTHQQAGLYGALLVEPAGSTWLDAITGKPLVDPARDDGGPTSWQAMIETNDSVESYREFAMAMGDLQLAYTADSTPKPVRPKTPWFSSENKYYQSSLDQQIVPQGLSDDFAAEGGVLGNDVTVKVIKAGSEWLLMRNDFDKFSLTLNGKHIDVRSDTIHLGWADTEKAIWPPTAAMQYCDTTSNAKGVLLCAGNNAPATCSDKSQPSCSNLCGNAAVQCQGYGPYPTIISDPGGGGNIGTWVANYRNEPLDARVQESSDSGKVSPNATNLSYAYSSIERHNDKLNTQPKLGSPIGKHKNGFKYPTQPLLPEGKEGVQGTDPYTPMMRAYAGDKVEVRAIVGAVDSIHSFHIQGPKWEAEPSYHNSGFRDTQGMGISEHFEMLFQLPPADASKDAAPFIDTMYSPSSGSLGLAKGTWGIMRTYADEVKHLAQLPNNPVSGNKVNGFYDVPPGVKPRIFNIELGMNSAKDGLQYTVNNVAKPVLVLRANAGDWIQVNLKNNLKASDAAKLPTTFKGQESSNTSSKAISPYNASVDAGINPLLISYDEGKYSGLNVGLNEVSSVPPGKEKTFTWYAGSITHDENSHQILTAVEFGGVNLIPSDPLLQLSYGLSGALIIEPAGATWLANEDHELTANIKDADGNHLFTEIVVAGSTTTNASAVAGTEVRLRVLNPNTSTAGQVADGVNLITVEGHGWPEEPYTNNSEVIGDNPLTQWMGTQQVTPLESYNMVLPIAGGVDRVAGSYDFYYYPKGPSAKLGTITVTNP